MNEVVEVETEAEEVEFENAPVRYVHIETNAGEDGGGLKIILRLDGEDPEKVLRWTAALFREIFEIMTLKRRCDDREVV